MSTQEQGRWELQGEPSTKENPPPILTSWELHTFWKDDDMNFNTFSTKLPTLLNDLVVSKEDSEYQYFSLGNMGENSSKQSRERKVIDTEHVLAYFSHLSCLALHGFKVSFPIIHRICRFDYAVVRQALNRSPWWEFIFFLFMRRKSSTEEKSPNRISLP